MFWIGWALLGIGALGFLGKLSIVWKSTRDLDYGGGVPTLDLPIFYPIFIAWGLTEILGSIDALPFPGFGFAVWAALGALAASLMVLFERLGKPIRARQLEQIQERHRTAG